MILNSPTWQSVKELAVEKAGRAGEAFYKLAKDFKAVREGISYRFSPGTLEHFIDQNLRLGRFIQLMQKFRLGSEEEVLNLIKVAIEKGVADSSLVTEAIYTAYLYTDPSTGEKIAVVVDIINKVIVGAVPVG
jgi:hypothetical protein